MSSYQVEGPPFGRPWSGCAVPARCARSAGLRPRTPGHCCGRSRGRAPGALGASKGHALVNCSWPLGPHPSPCPSLRSGLQPVCGAPCPPRLPSPSGCAAGAAASGVRARAAASAGPVRVSPVAAPAAAPSCALAIARGPRPSARLRQPPGGPRCGGGGPGVRAALPARALRSPARWSCAPLRASAGPPAWVGGPWASPWSAAPISCRPGPPLPCPRPAGGGGPSGPRASSIPGAAGRP